MSCNNFLQKKEALASNWNILIALQGYFSTLKTALPILDGILIELRGDRETSEEFQQLLRTVLDEEDYSAKTLSCLMFAYAKTHNQGDVPEYQRKPIFELAQQASKMICAIDDITENMNHLSQCNAHLIFETKKHRQLQQQQKLKGVQRDPFFQ